MISTIFVINVFGDRWRHIWCCLVVSDNGDINVDIRKKEQISDHCQKVRTKYDFILTIAERGGGGGGGQGAAK